MNYIIQNRQRLLLPLLLIAIFLAASSNAFAQNAMPNAPAEYNSVLTIFKNVGGSMFARLKDIAIYVFAGLFLIQFVVQGSSLAIKGGDFGDFIEFFVKQILYFGFFYWLVLNANQIGTDIVASFAKAGQKATGSNSDLAPASVMAYGLEMSGHIIKNLSAWPSKLGFSILAGLAALIVLIITAIMAVLIALALIESYIVVGASVLFMAFGGAVWTKDIAISMLRYAFSVGAKIFMMYVILGTAFNSISQWAAAAGGIDPIKNLADVLTLVSLFFFVLILFIKLPEMIQAVINGSTSASTGAGTIAAAAMGAAGGAMAVQAAGGLAASQAGGPAMQSLAGQSGMQAMKTIGSNIASSAGHSMRVAGKTLGNLGSAAANDFKGRLTGEARYGTMGGRMAATMSEKRHDMGKPSSPSSSSPTPSTGPVQSQSESEGSSATGSISAAETSSAESSGRNAEVTPPSGTDTGKPDSQAGGAEPKASAPNETALTQKAMQAGEQAGSKAGAAAASQNLSSRLADVKDLPRLGGNRPT